MIAPLSQTNTVHSYQGKRQKDVNKFSFIACQFCNRNFMCNQ